MIGHRKGCNFKRTWFNRRCENPRQHGPAGEHRRRKPLHVTAIRAGGSWRAIPYLVQSNATLVDHVMHRPANSMKSTTPSEPVRIPANPSVPTNYLDLYGLSKPPFGQGRDHAGYILFGSQRRAFELSAEHIVSGAGPILLRGEEGIGKSETLRAVAAVAVEAGQPTVIISRPDTGRLSLPQFISALNGQPNTGHTATEHMIDDFLAPPRKALLVDDIDLLTDECLRLLLALALALPADSARPAMILSFSAALAADSSRPDLTQLISLAKHTVRLSRLTSAESRQFIERSLWVAGGTARRLMAPDAVRLVVAKSGGVPGIIDRFMEAVLTTGFARADARITARTVAATVGPIAPRTTQRSKTLPGSAERVMQIAAAGLLVTGAAVFLYKGLSGHIQQPPPAPSRPITLPAAPAITPPVEQSRAQKPVETVPPELVAVLLKRGGQALGLGDITGARQLFQRAAEAGNAAAAVSLGKTYDPDYIAQGGKPEPASAITWYRKAVTLGDPRAADLIKRLEPR